MRLTLEARAFAVLDRRLEPHAGRPLALALSGGGDSVALLHLAARLCDRRGRRLLALTVDHQLHPDSACWTAFARRAAHGVGADWRGLRWVGDKPATGISAAARAARHALIAEAARAAGARVVLFAHTADDLAEAELMRSRGSTVGDPRTWSPSPAWPQGRGLMLLRPLLGEARADVRAWLAGRRLNWIEDPANADLRHARSRARRTLAAGTRRQGVAVEADAPDPSPMASSHRADFTSITLPRATDSRTLARALTCMGGGSRSPRSDRLAAVAQRLGADAGFTLSLAGARLVVAGDTLRVFREAGELARRPVAPLHLAPGHTSVWDGRFEITTDEPGWRAAPAMGRLASLEPLDRALVNRIPAPARGGLPVLLRDGREAPILAWRVAEVGALAPFRLALALDEVATEADLASRSVGETPPADLFLSGDGPSADRVRHG